MSKAELFLENNFIVAVPLISTDGKTFHCLTIDDAREYARLKSQEDNQELVEALRKITEISGTANRSAFNQIKDAVNDIEEIAETELAKHSK